jgi:hypothetical protein
VIEIEILPATWKREWTLLLQRKSIRRVKAEEEKGKTVKFYFS